MRSHTHRANAKRSNWIRLLKAWVAAIATILLVGAMSPVFADGTVTDPGATPDTTATDTTASTGTTATDSTSPTAPTDPSTTSTTASTDPSTTSTGSSSSTTDSTAGTTTSGSTSSATSGTTGTKKTTKTLSSTATAGATTLSATGPCAQTAGAGWTNLNGADIIADGGQDNTAYTQGSHEERIPTSWSDGGSANGKDDICNAYFWLDTSSGDVIANFGFQRDANTGDTIYDVEFNQAANVTNSPPQPNRTPGDLLLQFDESGSGPFTFVHAYLYTSTSSADWTNSCHEVLQAAGNAGVGAGWCPLALSGFTGTTSADKLSAEGTVDLTTLFGGGAGCSAVFHHVNMRSVASSENWTAALQDYVAPQSREIPSTCATLTIKKYRAGTTTLLTGAHYRVWSGTDTSQPALISDLSEGDSHDIDGTANDGVIQLGNLEPGTYTVREIQAPTGYFLPHACDATHTAPNCDTQTVTLARSGSATLSFFDPKQWQALTATKTAAATYDVQYAWQVKKYVRAPGDVTYNDTLVEQDVPTPAVGSPSAQFQYQVVATQTGATKSNFNVNGTIKVSNPNNEAVVADLSDSLSDATVCSIAGGGAKTIPANAVDQSYSYSCSYASAPASMTGTNTATISWDKSDYPQTAADVGAAGNYSISPTAGYTFSAANNTDKTVRITDDHNAAWDTTPWTLTGVESAPFTTETRTYNRTVTGTAGSCVTSPNTATLKSQDAGNATLSTDGASAKLCSGSNLSVTKNKTVSMTRTYLWQIEKTRTSAAQITSGQSADYSVTVSRGSGDGFQDSGWQMTGVITVANPNNWESVTMSSLTDVYSGGGSCSIDNSRVTGTSTWGSVVLTLTASQSRDYQYHCTFATQPGYNGTNTATATWDATTAHTPDGTAQGFAGVTLSDWTLGATPVNKVITVTDSAYTGGTGTGGHTLGTVDWDNAPHTFTYSITWTAPAGTCVNRPNTATIVETGQNSSASVLVCNPVDESVSKTAHGAFTRTYKWTLAKSVDAPSTVRINTYDHTFGYHVVLSQAGTEDSAWQVTGTITVTNNNTDSQIGAYSTTVTDAMTGVGGSPTCRWSDGTKGADTSAWPLFPATVSVASGAHADIQYVCTFASKPTYSGGTNKATASYTGASGTASSSDVPVSFTETKSIDKTVKVVDNKVTGSFVELSPTGGVTYGDDPSGVYTYTYLNALHNTSEGNPTCQDFTNTARVLGDQNVVLDEKQATATICPTPGTWEVSKSATPADGTRIEPGTDITYTLTAHHTGGVEANGVVLVDDLSNMIDAYATYVGVVGSPVGTVTAPTSGNGEKLTWNIGQLAIGATRTMQFTIHVKSTAWDVNLHNLVTSSGSDNCPTTASLANHPECTTDHHTTAKPKLTLVKSVDHNGTGATDPATAWDLSADGPTPVSDVKTGTQTDVLPGSYDLSEANGPSGYQRLGWKCGNDSDYRATDAITLASDQVVTCTVYNRAVMPKLTLRKVVDNGTTDGTATGSDWTLTATGPVTMSGNGGSGAGSVTGHDAPLGSYSLTEANGPAHYTQGIWECRDQNVAGSAFAPASGLGEAGSVSPALGSDMLCRVTNTADTGHYTVAKVSDPTSGSEVQPGSKITYTVTAKWHDGIQMKNVQVQDDLSNVLNHATLDAVPAGAVLTGTTLTWTIPLLSDSSGPATLQYTVTVNADAWNIHLVNLVTPKSPNGTCEVGQVCTTDDHTPKLPKLTLVKHVTNGLNGDASPSDWTLSAAPDGIADAGSIHQGTESGAGGFSGRSVLPGSYDLSEGGGPSGYTASSWTCSNAEGPVTSVSLSPNDDVTCEITNTQDAHWKVVKTSDPASGSTVQPDTDVTYTLTATHTSGIDPTNVVVTDDLSDVVDDATFDATQLPAGATYDEATHILTWNVGTLTGEQTLSYTVHVKPDARGVTLRNVVTGPGSDNCPADAESVGPDCTTVHPVPAWTLAKVSDPVTGSKVPVGSKVTYTLTVANTGPVTLHGATVTDDLSNVLNHATLDAVPAGATFDAATSTLTWAVPDVEPGESTTLVYSVTIGGSAYDVSITNVATPGQPTGKCVTDGGCTTTQTTPPAPEPPPAPPVNPPTPPQPAPPPSAPQLPNTGGPHRGYLPIGLGLVILGAGLMLAQSRRRLLP